MSEGLNVTIIGAGLAGLMTARVMRELHSVTILERFRGNHEIGAAISFGPTATKIAEQFGFDRNRVGSVLWAETQTFDKEGNHTQTFDMRQFAVNTGSDSLLHHRIDLWQDLHMLATAPSEHLGIRGNPATVVWDADAVDVDCERGEVTLANGRKIASDLVIGADGIKSILRPLIVGEDAFRTARPSGLAAFRFTMPAEQVLKFVPGFPLLNRHLPAAVAIYISMDGTNRSVVMYGCRNFEVLNFACITPESIIGKEATESWIAEGSRDDLVEVYSDYDRSILSLLEKAENINLWQLRDQDPLPTYIKGRAVIIGDAAHPMTPHQAQGGNQAIEDAEGFVLFNSPGVSRASVPEILKDFDRVRRQRASKIQNHTREVHDRKSPEVIFKNQVYNSTYDGIKNCLSRLDAGEEMIPIS